MKMTHLVASSALASLLLMTGGALPSHLSTVTTAEAAVSVNFSLFYNDLAPHGDWVRHRGHYVFVPARVGPGWRPYTVGHWVYGDNVGWTWASDEPFGWATYHYGRWGYASDIGWYWVPGTRWAPAWVSWRRGGDYVAWAPLPPERDGSNVSISISVGDIPDYYWVPVRTRNFLDIDLRLRIVDGDADRRRIIRRTEFLGVPRVRDRIVVNNVINVNVIEEETGREVRRVAVRNTDDPQRARATDEQVTMFEGEVTPDTEAKPKKVRDAAEIRKARKDRGEAALNAEDQDSASPEDDVTTGSTTQPADSDDNATDQNAEAPLEKKPVQDKAEQPDAQQPAKGNAKADEEMKQDNAEANAPDKKKPRERAAKSDNKSDKAKAEQNATAAEKSDQQTKKRQPQAKADEVRQNSDTGKDKGQANRKKLEATGKDKAKNSKAEAAQKTKQEKLRAAEQRGKQKELPAGKKKAPCDPENNANCAM